MTSTRRTLYLRPQKDSDILTFIEPLLKMYDFSHIIRELVRDGIKFRSSSREIVQQPNTFVPIRTDLQSNTPSFDDIKLEKKQASLDDLNKALDEF